MGQFFSQGYDHYEQCNAGVVFLQNTFWSFWFFFSFVKSKAFQGIKPKAPKNYSPKWQRLPNVQRQIRHELLGGG